MNQDDILHNASKHLPEDQAKRFTKWFLLRFGPDKHDTYIDKWIMRFADGRHIYSMDAESRRLWKEVFQDYPRAILDISEKSICVQFGIGEEKQCLYEGTHITNQGGTIWVCTGDDKTFGVSVHIIRELIR